MTTLADIMISRAVSKAVNNEKIEIAKDALKNGAEIEFVEKITKLDEITVRQLQTELERELALA